MKIALRLWMLGFWVLTGCAQAFPTVQAPVLPATVPTETEQIAELPVTETLSEEPESVEPTSAPTATSVEEPTSVPATEAVLETTTPSAEVPTEAPTDVPTETTPLGDSELHATNPSTVNLASGKPTIWLQSTIYQADDFIAAVRQYAPPDNSLVKTIGNE